MPQGQTRQTAASRARRIIAPVAAICAAAAVLTWPQASGAQSYPNRPIRMIIRGDQRGRKQHGCCNQQTYCKPFHYLPPQSDANPAADPVIHLQVDAQSNGC